MIFQPAYQVGKFLSVPGRLDKVKKPRLYATLGGLGLLAAAILLLPLPYQVLATLEVEPRKAAQVHVQFPGRLKKLHVKPGDLVAENQVLAELENLEVEPKIAEIESSIDQLHAQLESLRRQRFQQPEAASAIPEVQSAIEAKSKQLQEKLGERNQLTLRAPRAGMVFPPPWKIQREDPEERLPFWNGIPLDPNNIGCNLERNDLFCRIGDPDKLEAVLVIDQADDSLVKEQQKVDIKFDAFPFETMGGKIDEKSREPLKLAPKRLSAKQAQGGLATKTDTSGAERPASTSYQARVPLDDSEGVLRLGLRGQAKIHMDRDGWQTVGRDFGDTSARRSISASKGRRPRALARPIP